MRRIKTHSPEPQAWADITIAIAKIKHATGGLKNVMTNTSAYVQVSECVEHLPFAQILGAAVALVRVMPLDP